MADYSNSRWKERGSFSKDILHSYQDIVDAIRTAPYGIDTREAMAQMLMFLYSTVQSIGDNFSIDMSPTDTFENVTKLKEKYPNGQQGVFVVQDTGHWYFWSELDEVWKDGGSYQTPAPIDDIRKVDVKATQNSIKLKALLDNFTQEVDERKKIDADLIDKVASYLTALDLKEVRLRDEQNQLLWDGNNYVTGNVYLPKTDKTGLEEGVPADSSTVGYTFIGHLEEYGLPILKIDNGMISYLVNKQSGKLTDVNYSYNSSKNSISVNSILENGMLSEIKVQGSSSVLYPKKNYTIKFKDNKCLKPEWGYHKKYVIKADWIDPSHLRNEFGAYIWYLLRKRKMTSDYELQNNNGETLSDNSGNSLSGETRVNFLGPRCGAIDSFPILVVINGVYHGLYSLTIPKDDWMAGMGSGTKEAIVSAGKPSKATRFESLATLDSKGNLSGDDFEVEYVTDEDNQSWVATSLNNMIQEIMDADSKDDITLLDVDSAINYLIFCLYAENTDGFAKNFLLDTWDGNKWFVTAYDMDGTFGMMFDGKVMLSPWDYGINQIRKTNKLFDKLIKLFSQEIKDEWDKLHNSYLNESIIYYLISNKAKDIPQAAIDADRTRWPGLPGTTMNNLNQILQWISTRTQFLQNEFNTI
ncbi:CotH kinase family protein [Ligilactobacillus salivarius]|uniref:CotH kinase family protein n=1 Tax=Ligilactobacillus salivarius TaxID=1624 RepID=UPI0024B9A377|nr:CotH kinase family protein [Ligilactobacillus salivarius]